MAPDTIRHIHTGTKNKLVTVVGGSGFIGRYIVRELAKKGYAVQVASRNPETALFLKTAGQVGQVTLREMDICEEKYLEAIAKESNIIINTAGIYTEWGRYNFSSVHAQASEKLANKAKQHQVERFIHFSCLGVERASYSHLARSKANGDKAVLAAFPKATIIRPALVFGKRDRFLSSLMHFASQFKWVPSIVPGDMSFSPIYVADIAAITAQLLHPQHETVGETLSLSGKQRYCFRDIAELIQDYTDACYCKKGPVLPSSMAYLLEKASGTPVFTLAQLIRIFDTLNTGKSSPQLLTAEDFGIESLVSCEDVLKPKVPYLQEAA